MISEKGVSNHYLEIDLTSETWKVFHLTNEDLCQYIGGKGIGLKLYYDRVDNLASIDPLGPENLLCLAMGPLNGTGAPCSNRFDAVTKSPLTGIMVTSSCGGAFGFACKTAGWDGVILSGASKVPTILSIDYTGVHFSPAGDLWGLDTREVQEALQLTPRQEALVIGPAGEHQVLYANMCSGHRFLGRGGVGAVMGAKNLKAIVANGRDYQIEPALPDAFKKVAARLGTYNERNAFSKKYRLFGTNANTRPSIPAGYAPVYNFQDRTDPRIEHVSGEAMAKRYKTRSSACDHCIILCGHKGTYPDGVMRQIPEYETVGMFGPNIGNFDPDLIGVWNEEMNLLGLDTISTGGTLAWAMEASQKGIVETELAFERFDNISQTLKQIAYREGFGNELANGSRWLSKKYGGEEFACQVKGMEMAAYDPRGSWGQGLSYAVNNRGGCHLGSFLIGPEAMFGFLNPYSTHNKAAWAIFFENLYSAMNSLQICQFTAFSIILEPFIAKYTPKALLSLVMRLSPKIAIALMDWSILSDLFYSVTGLRMNKKELLHAGQRIQVLERYMNTLMGIDRKDDTLPDRFLLDPKSNHKKRSVVALKPMVRNYYRLRGYDDNGRPYMHTLEQLNIQKKQ